MFIELANRSFNPGAHVLFSMVGMGARPIDRLLKRATEMGMNQSQLAEAIKVEPQHITNWKSRGMPAAQHAAAARAVRMTVDELLGLTPPSEYPQAHEMSHPAFDTPDLLGLEVLMSGENYPDTFRAAVWDDAVAPEYPKGLELVWSTTKQPQVGSLVIVRTGHGQVHVRQYRQGKTPGHWIAGATADAFASFDSNEDGLQVLAVAAWRPMT